jgi:hypothetical protein
MRGSVDDYRCMRQTPGHIPEREPLRWVCGSYLRQNSNIVVAFSLGEHSTWHLDVGNKKSIGEYDLLQCTSNKSQIVIPSILTFWP